MNHLIEYNFRCETCGNKWTAQTREPKAVKCMPCNRKGLATKVTSRRRRKDATKRVADTSSLNIHSRPKRNAPRKPLNLSDEQKEDLLRQAELAQAEHDEDEMDEEPEDEEDEEYVPSPDFNPDLRFTGAGTFKPAKFHFGTHVKSTPWTRVTGKAGRGNTAAQFNNTTAEQYGTQHAPGYVGQAPATGQSRFEWCHLIADSLGGPTSQANLFCGTYHANTAMLCIEKVLRGKTQLEVKIEVILDQATHMGLLVNYRFRHPKSAKEFAASIDAQATGCTKQEGTALSGEARKWIGKYGR